MERKIAIEKAAEASLRAIIGKKGGNAEGEIFDQLMYLTDSIESFGETRLYISLPVKEALVRMLDADARFSYEVKFSKEGDAVEVTCYLKWSDCEEYSGQGTCTRFLPSIFKFDSLTEDERKEKWIKTCKSLARADAIRDALALGTYDFDDSDRQIANEEKIIAENEAKKKVPEMKSINEKKAEKIAAKAVKEEKPEDPKEEMPKEAPTEPIQMTLEKEFNTLPNEEEVTSEDMSLEEALKAVADIGTYKGNTLGDILKVRPRTIPYFVNQNSAVKDAAMVIIKANPELAEFLDEETREKLA